ncbi:hypothetical protein KPH14_012957 [Odynerus spinipes]|uniref:Uncharacterized protein n=1 Tax=Odynerus spinipes TaxID=1348599 RepID=A0AAD9R7V6_9HYME|nr:hypothetical protein KPH14_012957 [Odynerus spinipes]
MLGNSDAEDFIGDLFFQANVQNYMTGTNTLATIQGDPKLEVYHNDKEQTIKTFYESAGYNYFEKDGNYETQTKSIMNYDLDESTTKMKQADILYRLYKIIDLVLEDMGHIVEKDGIRTYSIEFMSTSIVNDIRELDIIDRRLANGTMEPIKAIQLLDKIPKKQAENYLKEIDKRQDQMIEKDIETQNKFNK